MLQTTLNMKMLWWRLSTWMGRGWHCQAKRGHRRGFLRRARARAGAWFFLATTQRAQGRSHAPHGSHVQRYWRRRGWAHSIARCGQFAWPSLIHHHKRRAFGTSLFLFRFPVLFPELARVRRRVAKCPTRGKLPVRQTVKVFFEFCHTHTLRFNWMRQGSCHVGNGACWVPLGNEVPAIGR